MSLGNVARVVAVLAAVVAAAGSATSESNTPAPGTPPQYGAQAANNQPPPPQQMEPSAALGLWRSTFGAVKIEADNSKGGLQSGAVQGIWVYQKQGTEVVGYFSGSLRGNVFQFRWQEPSNPPLTGEGYLVFDVQGRQYSGRWWSDRRDRVGDWNGWRNAPTQRTNDYAQPQYGGQGYADPYARPTPPQSDPYARPAPQQDPYARPGPYQPAPQPGPYDRQPSPYDRPVQPPQPQQPPPPPRGYY